MGVITISRGSYSKGKEIAQKLADKLQYECFSREVLLEASQHFNVPELKLVRALHNTPSFLEKLGHRKQKYIIFIREAFLEYIKKDNMVYHGLAGHFFLKNIPNVLKVRIVANIDDRVKEEMKRENISEHEARNLLIKDDEERRKWSIDIYGLDTKDPALYDLVLHIDNLNVDDTVDILSNVAQKACFQTTQESLKKINDAYLASKAHSLIYGKIPAAEVTCEDGIVSVHIETSLALEQDFNDKVKSLLEAEDEIKEVRVHIIPLFG